jgi:Flp pilus assembly pilin Flp
MLKLTVHLQSIAYRLRHREEGQTFVEYGLLIGGVSIMLLTAFLLLQTPIENLVERIGDAIDPPADT